MTGFEIAILLGLLASAGAATAGTLYTNKTNVGLNNQRWQDSVDLANTAHQREVFDLRAAGLNPILSTGTAGAAVPNMAASEVSNPLEGLGNLGKTAGNMLINSAAMQSQKSLNKTAADLNDKKNELAGAQIGHIDKQIDALKGDIAISKLKEEIAHEPKIKQALRDELLLRGAPKNAYEATYLGGSSGDTSMGEKVRKFFDWDEQFKLFNNKFGPGGYYWKK